MYFMVSIFEIILLLAKWRQSTMWARNGILSRFPAKLQANIKQGTSVSLVDNHIPLIYTILHLSISKWYARPSYTIVTVLSALYYRPFSESGSRRFVHNMIRTGAIQPVHKPTRPLLSPLLNMDQCVP